MVATGFERRSLPAWALAALLGCSGGGAVRDAGDDAVGASDAATSCADLRARWWDAVAAAGKACAVDADCQVVGEPRYFHCDSGGTAISDSCGIAVANAAYAAGAGPALEQAWHERACEGEEGTDCPEVLARCVDDVCVARDGQGCFLSSRDGMVVVTEATVVGHPELGSGASIRIRYEPSSSPDLVYDDMVPPGVGCRVYVHDSEVAPPALDEGVLTIAGARSSVPPCAFAASSGRYDCVAVSGATAPGDGFTPSGGGLAEVTVASAAFDPSHVGMHLRLSGADDTAADGAFPIVAYSGPTQVTVARAAAAAPTQWSLPGTYEVVAGLGPTEAEVDFLADGDRVTVAKGPGLELDVFEQDLWVGGAGFVLDAGSHALDAIPVDGSGVVLSCDGAGGDCRDTLAGLVFGRTTNAPVGGLPFDAMPPAGPGTYATWLCMSLSRDDVTIPAAAMTLILGSAPTRIELRYLRAELAAVGAPGGTTRLVVGHESIGYTDVP